MSSKEASHRKDKIYRRDEGKIPLSSEMEGKEFSRLLLQNMQGINRDIKEMRMERYRYSPRGLVHEESSILSHYGCSHSATPLDIQCGTMPTFLAREEEEGETQKEETLGDYL